MLNTLHTLNVLDYSICVSGRLPATHRCTQVLPGLTLAVHGVINMVTLVALVESNYHAEAPETVTGGLSAVLSAFSSSDFSIPS